MKIAIHINDIGIISEIVSTSEEAAREKSQDPEWTLVDEDIEFKIDNQFNWTLRQNDNKLVHRDTNMTPQEEKNTVITNLTLQNLTQANEITELKKFSTAQTLQSLQDAQDKNGLQKVITNQTMQILELQKSINNMKAAN